MTSTTNLFHQPSHDREAAREARLAAAKAHRTASYEVATVWSLWSLWWGNDRAPRPLP